MREARPGVAEEELLLKLQELAVVGPRRLVVHGADVVHQVVPAAELAAAFVARERLLSLVDQVVGLQLVRVGKVTRTNVALETEIITITYRISVKTF